MKSQCQWNDFAYQTPPTLSQECFDALQEIQGKPKEANDLYKGLYKEYYKEMNAYREVTLNNCSNFAFMTSFLDGKYREDAIKILDGYIGNPGFYKNDNKYVCNYQKALAFIEKAPMHEVIHRPIFGERDE